MNITTVGKALHFAKELEAEEMKLCQESAVLFADENIKNFCLSLANLCETRIILLEKVYNDFTFSDMDVGILEPIEPIDGSSYTGRGKLFSDKDNQMVFEKWYDYFNGTDRFYSDFSDRLLSGHKSLHRRIGKIISKRAETMSLIDSIINK